MSEAQKTVTLLPPGVYYNLDEREYRADPGISQSELKPIMRSAAHFRAGVESEEREDTDALILGRMVGQIAMEPDKPAWWVVRPEGVDLRTKAGKEWAASIGDAVPVSQAMFRTAGLMATALLDHKRAGEIIRSSKREVTVYDEYETLHGVIRRKGRIDLVSNGNVLADIKTTIDARDYAFRKSVTKYGYDIQAFSYQDMWNARCDEGQEKQHYLLIAIEKAPPFEIVVHHMSPEFMAQGAERYLAAINQFAQCKLENKWPGYPDEINELKP